MDQSETLTEKQMELIREQMSPGEWLHWFGKQPRAHYLRGRLVRIMLVSLWTGIFGLFAAWMILMNPSFLQKSFLGMLPVLTPLLLAALGGYLLGREIFRPRKRSPDLYALTDRRAVVISSDQEVKAWLYDLQAVRSIKIKRHKNGSGDILFERRIQWSKDAEGRVTRNLKVVGFYGLPCVDEVLRMLDWIERPDLTRKNQS